jgi:predicted ATPase
MTSEVLAVIAVGGDGAGKTVLLADFNQETLELVA